MLRISAALCATILLSAPAFAGSGGCQYSQDKAAETTEQKKESQS